MLFYSFIIVLLYYNSIISLYYYNILLFYLYCVSSLRRLSVRVAPWGDLRHLAARDADGNTCLTLLCNRQKNEPVIDMTLELIRLVPKDR